MRFSTPLEFAGDGLQFVLFDFAIGQQIDVGNHPFRIERFAEVPLAFQVQPRRRTSLQRGTLAALSNLP